MLGDSLFLWEFDMTDDYNLLEKGGTYEVRGYWYRIQFLSHYPVIYDLKRVA